MRITIDIDTDHPEAFDTLRTDLEGLLGHTDEHGLAATWVQIRESVYEVGHVRREWIGEGDAGGDAKVKCLNCGEEIMPDLDNGWAHSEAGVIGCGSPDAEERALYAEPAR